MALRLHRVESLIFNFPDRLPLHLLVLDHQLLLENVLWRLLGAFKLVVELLVSRVEVLRGGP